MRYRYYHYHHCDALQPFINEVVIVMYLYICHLLTNCPSISLIKHIFTPLQDGKFYLKDRMSSNGTMVYLRDPFPLSYSSAVKLRMGRTTISLQVS